MKLPELLGSEKQVKWANDIRQEYIDQLAQDEKLVEKYLELKEKLDDDSKELKDLQRKMSTSLFADMDQSRFGSIITPVMGADLADKQAFEDKVQDDTEGYLFADFSMPGKQIAVTCKRSRPRPQQHNISRQQHIISINTLTRKEKEK